MMTFLWNVRGKSRIKEKTGEREYKMVKFRCIEKKTIQTHKKSDLPKLNTDKNKSTEKSRFFSCSPRSYSLLPVPEFFCPLDGI
jgi:hypothetical protein